MKKVLIGTGAFLVLVVGILLVLPLFVNIDQFRPQIQQGINKSLQGQVELGPLSFRLFPSFRIRAENIRATAKAPFDQEPLMVMQSFDMELPLYTLLTGPHLRIDLKGLNVKLQSKGAESSLSKFLLAKDPNQAVPQDQAPVAEQGPPKAVGEVVGALPSWVQTIVYGAEMDFSLTQANLETVNLDAPKDITKINNLSFVLKDVGLKKAMNMEFSAQPQVVKGALSVDGVLNAKGAVTANPQGAQTLVDVAFDMDMAGLDMRQGVLFHKPAGTALSAGIKGQIDQSAERIDVDFSELAFRFANFVLKGKLGLSDATHPNQAQVNFAVQTNDTQIAPFGTFVPMIKSFDLKGSFGMAMNVSGPMLDPGFNISVGLKNIGGSTPQLKHPLSDLNGSIQVSGTAKMPVVEVKDLSMKIASSDIAVYLKNVGIDPIQTTLKVNSNNLNVDELLGLKALVIDPEQVMAEKAAAAKAAGQAAPSEAAAPVAAAPLDASVVAMAPMVSEQLKNPLLDKISADIQVVFKKITALGAVFDNGTFNMSLRNRILNVSKTGIGGYGGRVELDSSLTLKPDDFRFAMNAGLNNVKIERMLASHVPGWKKVASGTMVGKFAVQGAGLSQSDLDKKLKGSFQAQLVNGNFMLPIQKIVGVVGEKVAEKIVSFVPAQFSDKVAPGLNAEVNKFKSKQSPEEQGRFKTLKIASTIQGRKLVIQDLDVVYDGTNLPTKDIQFKSTGTISFDQQVELIGAAMFDPTAVKLNDLKGPSGKVELPLRVAGPMAEPKPDYEYTLNKIGGIYSNMGKRLLGEKADELKRLAQEKINQERARLEAEARQKFEAEKNRLEQEARARADAEKKKAVQKATDELKKKLKF